MKSPTCKVGIIEPDGILNGSTRNERNRNTIRITGKKLLAYSTHQGSFTPAGRLERSRKRSSSQIAPVSSNNENRIRAKVIYLSYRSFFFHTQDGEERLLRDFHTANLL